MNFGSRKVLSESCCCILLRTQVYDLVEHVYAKSHWLKGPYSCELSDWWQIGRDRRQSESVHSVNKIQVLSSMIRAVNVSRMQTVYIWRSRCACRLSLEHNLRGKKIKGHDSVSGPQNLSSLRICILPGCLIRMCTLLFGYMWSYFEGGSY
jgi:hypothetical protein